MMRYPLLLLLFALSLTAAAQAVNASYSLQPTAGNKYINLTYENDVFAHTDYGNTQNIRIDIAHPAFAHFPLTHLLLQPKATSKIYILFLEHNVYTPIHFERPEIQQGDYPFAAALMLTTTCTALDTNKHHTFTTGISLGIIGPAAGGAEMQKAIHRWTNDKQPQGWPNQIRNDVVLNYTLGYELELLHAGNYLLLSGSGSARIGTLSTNAALGATLRVGFFDNPFRTLTPHHRFSASIYARPEIVAIGYDATLQGGLFNSNNPYTIVAADISRILFSTRVGATIQAGRIYLEYYLLYTTKQFGTTGDKRSGGITIAVHM